MCHALSREDQKVVEGRFVISDRAPGTAVLGRPMFYNRPPRAQPKTLPVYFLNSAASHQSTPWCCFHTLTEKKTKSLTPSPRAEGDCSCIGSLDDKIELNRRMNETLEGMAQALFKSWFVDFDPVIDNALAAGNPIPEPPPSGQKPVAKQSPMEPLTARLPKPSPPPSASPKNLVGSQVGNTSTLRCRK